MKALFEILLYPFKRIGFGIVIFVALIFYVFWAIFSDDDPHDNPESH